MIVRRGVGRVLAVAAAVGACTANPAGRVHHDASSAPATSTTSTSTAASTTTTSTATTSTATTSTTASTATTSTSTTSTSPAASGTTAATTTSSSTPSAGPVRVLVVGDSVAASLAGAGGHQRVDLDGVGEVQVHNAGMVACPVILDGEWWFSDGSTLPVDPSCDGADRYDEVLAAVAPDVVLALFGWPGVGGGQRFPDGEVSVPCETRFDRAWASGHRSMIERLAPAATVVVATVAPISMDPRRPETGCLNHIVRRLPTVIVDVQHWLCPDLDCSALTALRPDGVHFTDDPDLRREALEGVLREVFAVLDR